MNRTVKVTAFFLFFCLTRAFSAESNRTIYFVNPASTNALVPAQIEAENSQITAQNGLFVIPPHKEGRFPDHPVYGDVAEGKLYLYTKIPAFSVKKITENDINSYINPDEDLSGKTGSGTPGTMRIKTENGIITLPFENGSWRFYDDGKLCFCGKGIGYEEFLLGTSVRWQVIYNGAAITIIEAVTPKSENTRNIRAEIYPSGVVTLKSDQPQKLTWSKETPHEVSCADFMGYTISGYKETLNNPNDWIRVGNHPGIHIGYEGGEISVSGTNTLTFEGSLKLKGGVKNTRGSRDIQPALSSGTLILNSDLTGPYKHYFVRCINQGSHLKSVPDFVNDMWLFSDSETPDKIKTVFQFIEFPDDLDGEADTLQIYNAGGKTLEKLKLSPRFTDDHSDYKVRYTSRYHSDDNKGPVIDPEITLIDQNDNGVFFIGSIFLGGYPQQDKVLNSKGRSVMMLDLDNDNDCDIQYSKNNAQFDFEDIFTGILEVKIDPAEAIYSIANKTHKNSVLMAQRNVSFYNKNFRANQYYKEAHIGFDEHMSIIIPKGVVDIFPEGAHFFYNSQGDELDRMTMGRLGAKQYGFDWQIEMNPGEKHIEEITEDPQRFEHVVSYKDPWGHGFKALSVTLPDKWDGSKLKWETRNTPYGKAVELFPNASWYLHTTGKHVKADMLHTVFRGEGGGYGGNEGMYGGELTHLDRVEHDESGNLTFTLYYSSLMGALHLKGGDWGNSVYPEGWKSHWWKRQLWYHYPDGITKRGRFQSRRTTYNREGKRHEGIFFLYYLDRDHDLFFDTYIYDMDNDGIYDKKLVYDTQNEVISLQNNRFKTLWPYQDSKEEVPYRMENYQKIKDLYRKGYHQDPAVKRFTLSSSGIPIEDQFYKDGELVTSRTWRPEFYFILGKNWLKNAAVFADYDKPGRFTWKDFSPTGFTRLGTLLAQRGYNQNIVRETITEKSLNGNKIFVIGHLAHIPSEKEIHALLSWVKRGGTLIINDTSKSEEDKMMFNELGRFLGFTMGKTINNRTIVTKLGTLSSFTDLTGPYTEERTVTALNHISNYSTTSETTGILTNINFLSFVGASLELETPLKPLLKFKNKPIIAEATFNKGRIIVSGMNIFSDHYVNHTDYKEPHTQNDLFLRNLVSYVLGDDPPRFELMEMTYQKGPKVSHNETEKPGHIAIRLKGSGGNVFFPQVWLEQKVLLNGNPVTPHYRGALNAMFLPPGTHKIEIR